MGRTDAEVPILWSLDVKNRLIGKDPDDGKDWRQKEKGTTEDEVVERHHRLHGHEFEQSVELVKDRECWRAAVHKLSKSWTQQLNHTDTQNFGQLHRPGGRTPTAPGALWHAAGGGGGGGRSVAMATWSNDLLEALLRVQNQVVWGTCLTVRWLGFCAPRAEAPGSIPGQGTRPHAPQLRDRACCN